MLQWLQGIQKTTVVRRNLNLQALDSRCLWSCCLASWQQMLLPGLETFRHPIDTSSLAHSIQQVCRNLPESIGFTVHTIAQNASIHSWPLSIALLPLSCASPFLPLPAREFSTANSKSIQGHELLNSCHWTQNDSNLQFWGGIIPNFWWCSTQEFSMSFSSCSFFLRATSCVGVAEKCLCHPVWHGDLPVASGSCLSCLIFQVPITFRCTTLCFAKLLYEPNSGINSDLTSRIWRFVSSTCPKSCTANRIQVAGSQPVLSVWSVRYTGCSQNLPFFGLSMDSRWSRGG